MAMTPMRMWTIPLAAKPARARTWTARLFLASWAALLAVEVMASA